MSTKETLKNENPFVRVGTTLYKIVSQPRLNGGHVKKRIVWNNETLRQDYGKDYLAGVPKYDGFCTVPDHVNYCQVIDNFLNLYEPIGHEPKEGDFSHIQALVRHIFGEQYSWVWITYNSFICSLCRNFLFYCWYRKSATPEKVRS